ncbi:MAG: hypothetical protein GY782_12545 [Gammaproteobacteria bacterium]|nr:hypothetical protein [Gammaproteobacteria bacterium]
MSHKLLSNKAANQPTMKTNTAHSADAFSHVDAIIDNVSDYLKSFAEAANSNIMANIQNPSSL